MSALFAIIFYMDFYKIYFKKNECTFYYHFWIVSAQNTITGEL